MRILLVRHGESEGNIDPVNYLKQGDQNISLTDKGWQQAIDTGKFLRHLYSHQSCWPLIYLSSYQRTKETLSGIAHGIGDKFPNSPNIFEDPRLIEKHFGATNMIEHPEGFLNPEFAAQLKSMSDSIYEKDPFTTRNPLGESNKDNLLAVKSFIDGTFKRDIDNGHEEFLCVTHGATIINFLLSWAHLPMARRDDIPRLGNCDVVAIEGGNKRWHIHKIYDGTSGQAVDIDLLKGIKPYLFEDLPDVPTHLRSSNHNH